MKKIFTLISMAFMAMSVNAQDVYDAIVDGKLAPEFAAVAGENGGVANNIADGKSIVTMTAGKATVTAVDAAGNATISATLTSTVEDGADVALVYPYDIVIGTDDDFITGKNYTVDDRYYS